MAKIEEEKKQKKAEDDYLAEQRRKFEAANTDEKGYMIEGNSDHITRRVIGADNYKETIKKADGLFKMKRYAEAKPVYEEALKYKPNDAYATKKLADIEKLMAPK